MERQHTLARPVTFEGPGTHRGKPARMTVLPAEAGSGIRFQRVDLPGRPILPATPQNVVETVRCTILGQPDGKARVSTIEHLMSAMVAGGLDNVLVQVDDIEVPRADGAAQAFFRAFDEAGRCEQDAPRTYRRIANPIVVREGNRQLLALPCDHFEVQLMVTNDHRHPALSDRLVEYTLDRKTYAGEIAPCRTWGFTSEVRALRDAGLAAGFDIDVDALLDREELRGPDVDTVVIVGEQRVLTPLRFPDEMARHKVLDLIGDLGLCGPLHAQVIGIRSSHRLNTLLARRIVEQAE